MHETGHNGRSAARFFGGGAWAEPKSSTEIEAEVGRKAAAEIEKAYSLADMPDQGGPPHPIANETGPVYRPARCHLYLQGSEDRTSLNAPVIPGGTVYFTQGLVKGLGVG